MQASPKSKRNHPAGYLLVKGRYGLGNRILFLLSAIVSARASGRQLVVDWNDGLYGPEGTNAFPHYFTSPTTMDVSELPTAMSVKPDMWANNLEASYYCLANDLGISDHADYWKLSADLCDFDSATECLVVNGTRFNPGLLKRRHALPLEWKTIEYEQLVRTLLREQLKPTPRLKSLVDRFVKERFVRPVIGVHVRHTDNLMSYDLDRRGMVHSQVSIEAVAKRLNQHPESKVFLATDDRGILESFQSNFPGLIYYDKWFADEGLALHQTARRMNFDTDKMAQSGFDPSKMAEAAFVELFLLAACDYIIFDSRSSFAQLAVYWSDSYSEDVAADNLKRTEQGE